MLDQFKGRLPGEHAYLECTLGTDLSTDYQDESIPPHKQVDVKLPNGKMLRLPYSWLRQEGESPSDVLNGMLDASEDADAADLPPKKVAVKRAAPPK